MPKGKAVRTPGYFAETVPFTAYQRIKRKNPQIILRKELII
ncbi:hypothetical protein [Ruminococcus flavefaciens]|nr:hypothetical protein [Ruminococcus flavefaciens]